MDEITTESIPNTIEEVVITATDPVIESVPTYELVDIKSIIVDSLVSKEKLGHSIEALKGCYADCAANSITRPHLLQSCVDEIVSPEVSEVRKTQLKNIAGDHVRNQTLDKQNIELMNKYIPEMIAYHNSL